uniref:Uncharacterized protein n=1 Tax=Kalmanozyma brasiliensis (strain GHG001) TaxID=1365824 RepID=V5GHW8_KALBG
MVKVKLRVPLSSAPREAASSPLANPLRSAPDYSDDEEPTTPRRDGATPDDTADLDNSDAEELEDDEDEDPEADELDELDELEGDDDASSKPADASAKRRSITLKRPSKSGPNSSASPSAEGSTSPHLGAKVVKRSSLARTAQLQAMSVEELDALPAAKRRKTAKARGAAGPGRGWRKGLTKGQKPVSEGRDTDADPTQAETYLDCGGRRVEQTFNICTPQKQCTVRR